MIKLWLNIKYYLYFIDWIAALSCYGFICFLLLNLGISFIFVNVISLILLIFYCLEKRNSGIDEANNYALEISFTNKQISLLGKILPLIKKRYKVELSSDREILIYNREPNELKNIIIHDENCIAFSYINENKKILNFFEKDIDWVKIAQKYNKL